jgi:hypothetical protein
MKQKRTCVKRSFIGILCIVAFYPAAASVTWYGDFSTNTGGAGTTPNLRQYPNLQCGGTGGDGGTCPYLNDGMNSTHGEQQTSGIQAPLTGCPAGVGLGGANSCRLFFVNDPPPPPGVLTPVLQVRLGPNDLTNSGKRNELVYVKEPIAGGNFKTEYGPGDERYFAWYTQFPSDFPAPESTPSWRNFGQFHGDGNCGGPVLDMALIKDGSGTGYLRRLTARTCYNHFDSERYLWTAPPDFGNWHYYVLHVYFSQTPCNNGFNGSPCNWDSPNGGVIELWVDNVNQVSWAGTTVYTWPSAPACDDDRIYYPHPVEPMNNYLKQGLYRDFYLTTDADRVFHAGMKAATSCLDVLPANSCATHGTGPSCCFQCPPP